MKENEFQRKFIASIHEILPDAIVIKNDASYRQGFPDLVVLNDKQWAALECKRCANASKRPNQEEWIKRLGQMSYASFVFPENQQEVLDELQQALLPRRPARVSKRK